MRAGIKPGVRAGLASGVSSDELAPPSSGGTTTLTVAISDSADPAPGNANFSYSVVVTNTGSIDATSVVCDVQLDATLTYVSGSGTGWSVSNLGSGHIQATRATGAVGAMSTITITVTPTNADATVSTTADADASNSAPATQDTETTGIVGQTTLTVVLNDSADPVITLVNYSYSCLVTNTGANSATNVTALVTLDPQSTFVSASGTGWTCGHSGGVVTCTRASLAVGAAPVITVTVTSPSAGETSTATADADADNSPAAAQDTENTVVNLVTKDATSGIRVPASSTEWTNFLAYHGISVSVASLWLCQESSGNLADSIGSLTLTANGTPLYSQAVSGWTRLGVGFNEGAAQRFMAASGSGPNPTTTSQLWCFFASITAIGGTRTWISVSDTGATQCLTRCNVTPVCTNVTVGATVSGADNPTNNGVVPYVLQYDRANSKSNSYNDIEKITGTYNSGVLDGRKGIGGAASNPPTGQCVYGFMLSGANAEISTATLKTLLQAMGWTISWS